MKNRILDFLKNIKQKGFFHLLYSQFWVQLLAFASQFIVAWILTVDDIGRIRLLQSILAVAVIFADFGLNMSTLKLCSEQRPEGEKLYLFKVAATFTLLPLFTTFFVLELAVIQGWIGQDSRTIEIAPWYFIALVPLAINNMLSAYLQALKQFKIIALVQSVTKLLSVALIVWLTFVLTLKGYVLGLILGLFLTTTWFLALVLGKVRNQKSLPVGRALNKHFSFANYAFLSNVSGTLASYMDIFLINYLIIDLSSIGQYSFAVTAILGLQVFTGTVQRITLPYFSEKSSQFGEWSRVFYRYLKPWLVGSALLGIASWGIVPSLVSMAFDKKYDPAMPLFQVLVLQWWIRCLYSYGITALNGLGRMRLNFYGTLFHLPISFIVLWLSIEAGGVFGAAYGSVASAIVRGLILGSSIMYVFYMMGRNK